MPITLTVNGKPVEVQQGASVLDAVNASGTYIPQLCKDPDMKPIAACRTCLVQIDGQRGFPASCSIPARDGMVVQTETPEVRRVRRGVLELTLAMVSPAAVPSIRPTTTSGRAATLPPLHTMERGPRGEVSNAYALADFRDLTRAARHHDLVAPRWAPRRREPVDASNPVFNIDMSACIMCGRCAQGCGPGHQFIGAIDVLGAGQGVRIGTFDNKPLVESVCTTCGTCLSVCPTGAIHVKQQATLPPSTLDTEEVRTRSRADERPPSHPPTSARVEALKAEGSKPVLSLLKGRAETLPSPLSGAGIRSVSTTCPYCGVGCGIKLKINGQGRIVEVEDDPENRSSLGMLCVKGRFGYTFVQHSDRITQPLIKENGVFRPATWDEALERVAEKFVQYRGDAFATLCSAKATNEDGYVQQKFARLVMQSNHIDHCTRLCHSPSVEAMLTALGSGATSNSYVDYEQAGCLMIIGSDATSNHPVAASRMRRAVVERGAKLIIVNPKRIDMCDYADLWLRPYPGTDVALLNAMAKVVLDEGLADMEFVQRRTEGFEAWRRLVDRYAPEYAERLTGVSAEDIRQAARYYACPPFSGSCLIWGMGITQHTNGTPNAHSLLNLALVSGQLGKPGSGVSPLRGQNNVQGCGDAGCLPNSFPGYQSCANPQVRARFEQAWGGPIPPKPGMVITETIEAILHGRTKCMYIVGENPLLSEPDLHHAEEALRKLEFLVVQDIFMHETAEVADVVLPACSFAEKDGTFTNSERRVQRVRKAIEPIGQSRADWEIVCDLARRVSRKLGLGLEGQFSYRHPSEIWAELALLTPIVAGISHERLDREGGIQWPCPAPDHPGTPYLYADSFPRGPRALFVGFDQETPAAELPTKRFPLILNTGRILYHWHGGTITRRASGLLARSPELRILVHPNDAAKHGVADGEWVRVRSRRGELEGRALVSEGTQEGSIFVPFVKLQRHAANFLTNAALDPRSKIPEYKVCAVRIEKVGELAAEDQPRRRPTIEGRR